MSLILLSKIGLMIFGKIELPVMEFLALSDFEWATLIRLTHTWARRYKNTSVDLEGKVFIFYPSYSYLHFRSTTLGVHSFQQQKIQGHSVFVAKHLTNCSKTFLMLSSRGHHLEFLSLELSHLSTKLLKSALYAHQRQPRCEHHKKS